jgi:hypothetical protein
MCGWDGFIVKVSVPPPEPAPTPPPVPAKKRTREEAGRDGGHVRWAGVDREAMVQHMAQMTRARYGRRTNGHRPS